MFNDRLKLARLKDIKSAFINNFKRYLSLIEFSQKREHSIDNCSYNCHSDNRFKHYKKLFLSSCYPYFYGNRDFTANTKYYKSYTPSNKTGIERRNIKFFIDEIRRHYTILNDDLITLTQLLNITMNEGQFIPVWRQRLEICFPNEVRLTDFVNKHLEKDNPELLQGINNYVEEISKHNARLLEFRNNLRQSIERKFKEKDIEITVDLITDFIIMMSI